MSVASQCISSFSIKLIISESLPTTSVPVWDQGLVANRFKDKRATS